MLLVLISAVILTVWELVPRAVDPLLANRYGTLPEVWIRGGAIRHTALVTILTGLVALPFTVAIVLTLRSVPKDRVWHRQALRSLMAALASAVGLAIMHYPLDGMRSAWLLRDRSAIAFYHQYRIWPGEHVSPYLELITPAGESRSYLIARNAHYQADPEMRTDANQAVIWFADAPTARVRYGVVWCSIHRTTGEFISAAGPYPAVVSETSGFSSAR